MRASSFFLSTLKEAPAEAELVSHRLMLRAGLIKKLVVIVINARADPASAIYQSSSRPGVIGMIGAVTSIPIDSTTSSVASQMDVLLAQFNAAGGGGAQ